MADRTLTPSLVAVLVALSAVPGTAHSQGSPDTSGPPLEVIHGFTLIDGLGGAPLQHAALGVRGNEIVQIGTESTLLAEARRLGAIVIDLGGGFVVPGLIDAHVHLATVPDRARAETELRRLVYSGVTAVRDMAGDARALASLARDAQLGEIEAPDIYFSALMAGPSFLSDPRPRASTAGRVAGDAPWMQAITPDTDVRLAVARASGTSATGIKIYANLEAEEVRRVTEEAHAQGMAVWAHTMVFPARPLEVIRAGVDVVSHVCRLAWEAMADAPEEYHHDRLPDYSAVSVDAQVFDEVFAEMRERGTVLDATLAMYSLSDRLRQHDPVNAPPVRCATDFARQLVRRAHAERIPIVAGTDFTTPEAEPYPALHDELEELVAHGGLTPMEAIEAATRVPARILGLSGRQGTLTPGAAVSFVLLERDPTLDVRNLRSVKAVWKNAVRFDRSDFQPSPAPERPGAPSGDARRSEPPR